MRALALLALPLLIAGCSRVDETSGDPQANAEAPEIPEADGAPLAECALNGAKSFAKLCRLEFVTVGENRQLVIWHPNGSFRRFNLLDDGRGLEAADGADQVAIAIADEDIDVAIDGDRYRLPANIRDHGAE